MTAGPELGTRELECFVLDGKHQWIKVFLRKPDDLNSVSRSHCGRRRPVSKVDLCMHAHTIIINKVNKNKRPFPLNVYLRRLNSLSGNVTGRGWREGTGFRVLAGFAKNGCL